MKFLIEHWKLGFHLVFRTRYFGVNNQWFSQFPSWYGLPLWKILLNTFLIVPLIKNFTQLKVRLSHSHGWVSVKDYESIFGSKKLYKN